MRAQRRRDARWLGVAFTLAAVLGGGLWLDSPAPPPVVTPSTSTSTSPAPAPAVPHPPREAEIGRRFDEAVVMLHAKQFGRAATALHRLLAIAPTMPEAHVNMGYAMLGLQRPEAARDFFDSATALKPDQANAYYGLALAWEASGDLAMATGAMRSYLHLARSERPEHLRRARAALWEWEQARETAAPAPVK